MMRGRRNLELVKVKRELQYHGNDFTIFRTIKNEFGEDMGEIKQITIVRGLFHVNSAHETQQVGDSTISHRKNRPSLLCLFNSESSKIEKQDIVMINGAEYVVSAKNNVLELNMVYDITLEKSEHE